MKTYIIIAGLLLMATASVTAQKAKYNVVFDLTSKDTVNHKAVIHLIKEIVDNNPDAKVEVVFYGASLDMVTKGKSVVTDDVIKYAQNKNVAFSVCSIALKNNNLDKSQLIAGVGTVPDGIYEIIS